MDGVLGELARAPSLADETAAIWGEAVEHALLTMPKRLHVPSSEAEDLRQELRLYFFQHGPAIRNRFRHGSRFNTYLFSIALRRSLRWKRHHRRVRAACVDPSNLSVQGPTQISQPAPDAALWRSLGAREAERVISALWEGIGQLSPLDQALLTRTYFKAAAKTSTVAAGLGITAAAAYNRKSRAMKRLAKHLAVAHIGWLEASVAVDHIRTHGLDGTWARRWIVDEHNTKSVDDGPVHPESTIQTSDVAVVP